MKNISFDKFMNYLIIGYAFVLPITIVGIVFFTHIIILAFLVKGNYKELYSEAKKSKVIIAFFLLIALSLVAVIWSSDKIFALLYIKKYYHFLIIPIIYLTLNPKYINHIFTAFLSSIFISQIFSFGIFFELIQYNNVLPSDPSPFMNHSDYSLYLAFASMILLNRLFFTSENKHKVFYVLYFITTVSNLFIVGGRTGQIIFVAALFVVLFLNIKNKIKAITIATVLSVGIVTIAYNTSPVFKTRGGAAYNDITNTITNNNYSQSFGIRVSLWIIGAKVFSNNMLLGTGIGDENTGIEKDAEKYNVSRYMNYKEFIDYHSMYMQHAVQLGILGLLLMFYLIYSIFTIKFKLPQYRNLSMAFAISIFIYSLVGNVLHTIMPMAFFAFFIAVLIAISRSEHIAISKTKDQN